MRYFQSDRHRKIAQYVSLSGDVWDSIGHGTHTSGSIAGKPVDGSPGNAAKYQGMAPDARLAFFDLGRANSDAVMIPYALDASYFPYAYQAVGVVPLTMALTNVPAHHAGLEGAQQQLGCRHAGVRLLHCRR